MWIYFGEKKFHKFFTWVQILTKQSRPKKYIASIPILFVGLGQSYNCQIGKARAYNTAKKINIGQIKT